MRAVYGALLALGSAWLWDRLWYRIGLRVKIRLGLAVPLGEEIFKYGWAGWFGVPRPLMAVLFGLGEGLFEAGAKGKGWNWGLLGLGLAAHSLFGSVYLLPLPGPPGLFMACLIHLIWNAVIVTRKKAPSDGSK